MRGDILFYHETGPFDRIIQWVTHGSYNHVAVEVEKNQMIEAKRPRVRLSLIRPDGLMRVSLGERTSDESYAKGRAFLQSAIGDAYDFLDVLTNLLVLILPHGPFPRTPAAYDCSELVAYYLQAIGYADMGSEEEKQHISPNDLWRLFEKKGQENG